MKQNETVIPFMPVYYHPRKHPALVESMAREGATIADIAYACGLTARDFGQWRSKYPAIDEALQDGYSFAGPLVQNEMFKLALGQNQIIEEHCTTESMIVGGEVVPGIKILNTKTVIKNVLPDFKAQKFILCNIDPEHWKDKRETKVSGEVTHAIEWNETRQALDAATRRAIKAVPVTIDIPALIDGED